MHLYACVNICIGHELCIFYTDVRAPKAERSKNLFDVYRFKCTCYACTVADIASSDLLRERIMDLNEEIPRVGPTRGIPMVTELLDLCAQEGIHLHSIKGQACFFAFQLTLSLGNMPAAQIWIERTYEHRKMCHGPDHAITLQALSFLEKPETHFAYEVFLKRRS